MASVGTTAETADQLLVPNNVIKLELPDKNKETSNCTPIPPFVNMSETNSSISAPTNLSSVDSTVNPECSVANFGLGNSSFLENVKSPEEKKPLSEGNFISNLVPRKHEVKLSNSRRGSLNEPPKSGSPSVASYLSNYDNACSLSDLPSGSTEADFGLVKEELHIEDIEVGAPYTCLSSNSIVTENLFSSPLPDSVNPFIKETEAESLLKTDVRMNENATQQNVPQMLDLLNKPAVKPIRRQRVKKTPKIGARLSSVISKLAQTKQTLILSQKDPSSSANSNSQNSFPTKPIAEACAGSTQLQNGIPTVSPADTASVQTTLQKSNNAQTMSNSTNQCLENSISNKYDEFSIPKNSISATPDPIDKTKSILVVDRLKRLGTSIEVEKPTADAFLPSTDGRSMADGLNKSEPSITIEPQPFVTTRSLSQSLLISNAFEPSTDGRSTVNGLNKSEPQITIEPQPSVKTRSLSMSPPVLRVPPPPKPKTVKKATKPSDSEVTSPKSRTVKTSPNVEKPKPATETVPSSSEPSPSLLEPSDDINLLQYKNCLNVLESLVKADDLVKDITKNCIKNKTNRKINKNVLKYDSKLSKQNWKSNLIMNESSPSKTTLILNKTIPSKTKIKIINNPVNETNQSTKSSSKETESTSTSQKIDGESVKAIMDKHTFTIGDNSVIEMPNGQKMYTCDVCSGVYQKGFSLKRHYLRSHINYYFIHVKEQEANGEFTIQLSGGADGNGGLDPAKALLFRCHVCGTCFSVKSELKGHLTAHPPVNSISNNDVKVYECINCSTVFNKKKEFSKHRKTCVIEVPVVATPAPRPKQRLNEKLPCLFCSKVFPSPMERRKHGLKMHFPKRKGGHPCFKCVETFQTQASVYLHLREVHRNDYFSCSACKERFHNDLELKAHCTKKHNGNADAMMVLSDKNGVIESFEDKSEKVEKTEKPEKSNDLICSICVRTFSSQSNLNKHTKTMHLPDDKVTLSAKHVVVLSKSGSIPGKETKSPKTKIDIKSKSATPKSKADSKSKDPDTAFYSELSDNIQFNLMHHIDGKLQSEKKNATLSTSETTTKSPSSATAKNDSPSKTQSLAQLELVGKSTVSKEASTKVPDEKPNDWFGNTLNYTEDMSHLDIATQLTMKRNIHILNSSRAKSEDTSQVCGNIRLKRVKDLSKDLSLERAETLCAESFGDSTFGALESNVGLSGFWVRPHSYVCVTCGSQSVNFWDMEDHKWNSHPNVKCSHFEFTENHLPGYEFFTSRPFSSEGASEADSTPEVPSVTTNQSRCSKCKKVCSSTLELHRHMLDCGLDTEWHLTLMPSPSKKQKEKKKWRPFGSRRRRMSRVRGLKRNIPNSPMKIIFHPKLPPGKSKSGDTETIQKMIANLPAKRATRRVVMFEDPNSRAGQATINSVPITSLNWNNNTYEDGLIENLLKNDQQAVPSGFTFIPSNGSIAMSQASKDHMDPSSSPTNLLSNLAPKTRIVPIWPPAELSDVLTSLRMMPIPQVPVVTEAVRPVIIPKTPEPDVKPAPEALKPARLVPPKTIKLRSLVRQLSASALDSPTESQKKSPVLTEKSPDLSSGSISPTASEIPIKVNADKATSKNSSAPTSPSKVLLALSKYSVKKPSDLAKEKSTILDAMRIAMANSNFSDGGFDLKPGKGKKLLKKSLSESLLTGINISKPESAGDENQFNCVNCSKVFKNGAVLKRHLAKCTIPKLSESLSNMPDLTSSVCPTAGEIESLISSPVVTPVKTNTSTKTKTTPPQSKLSLETPQVEAALKSNNVRTKKTVVADVESKVSDKVAKALKPKTSMRKVPETSKLPASNVEINPVGEEKKSEEFANGKEEATLDEVTGEMIVKQQNFIPKSRKKVSIFTRSGKSKPRNVKADTAIVNATGNDTEVIVRTIEVKAEVHLPLTKKTETSNVKTTTSSPKSVPKATTSSLSKDISSDSDTDSTPLVQLKEILNSTHKTDGKPKKKVLVVKKKILRKRQMKHHKNLIRVKIDKPSLAIEKPETAESSLNVGECRSSQPEIEPLPEAKSSKVKVVKKVVRPKSTKAFELKIKPLGSKTKRKVVWNKGTRKSIRAMKNTDKIDISQDSTAVKPEDEIKEDPNLDESFHLRLSEEDEKLGDLPLASSLIKEETEGVKTDLKEELVSAYLMPGAAESTKQETFSDAKSTSSNDEAPSKPKRKRRSAYNLLFTNLKQEDMNELLTTIQADRQTLKRKCTVMEAVDKKVPKLGSMSDGESAEKSSDTETLSQTEMSARIQATIPVEAPITTQVKVVRRGRLINTSEDNQLQSVESKSDGESVEKSSDAESLSKTENTRAAVKKLKKVVGKLDEESAEKLSDAESLSKPENTHITKKKLRKSALKLGEENAEKSSDAESLSQSDNQDSMVKKLRRFAAKLHEEKVEKSNDAETLPQSENEAIKVPEKLSTVKGEKAVGLSKKGKAGSLKRGIRGSPADRVRNLGVTRRSAADSNKNLKQTILDDWYESDIASSSEVAADQVSETASTSNGKTKQKPSIDAESLSVGPQIPVNRRKKNQKLSPENKKTGVKIDVSTSAPKSPVKSSVKAKNPEVSEVMNEPQKFEAPQPLVSPRTRGRKLNPKLTDVPPSSESATEFELDPVTGELRPVNAAGNSLPNGDTVGGSEASHTKSKNAEINAKTDVNKSENVESVANEVSNTPVNSKKRKRPKKSVAKDVNPEVTSDDDNIPLSSLSEENIASSLSIISEDTDLSDINQKSKKSCPEPPPKPHDSVDADDMEESDGNAESVNGNFLPLLRTKNKSKNLKRKRRKEIRQKSLLTNVDSPMTSDSEASILRVRKKQLKTKKSSLAKEISSKLDSNDLLINNAALKKQLAKVKTTEDIKKVLDLISKGKIGVNETETSDPSIPEQSNDAIATKKKKLKKKKSKKKLKNLKDKDLVNVLVQTVAKTANKLLTKKSAEQLRKKQLKLQRKKALEKLSHANNAWKISIVNPESTETLTTEIPDSSNDLEEKKPGSDKVDSPTLKSDEIESSQTKSRPKHYCSLCDKNFYSDTTFTKHFTMWKHMCNAKLLKAQSDSDIPKVGAALKSSSLESASISSNTSLSSNISLSSLKNKLSAATKLDDEPAVPAVPEPPPVLAAQSPVLQELPVVSGATAQPVLTEPREESYWSDPSWHMNSAPEPVDSWYHDAWPKTSTYETASLGSILDTVNQILADPSSMDPHGEPISQYSLADLQHAIGASDEEIALLQQFGENCQTASETEYVYDNSAVQQASQPAAFNEWTCESEDIMDLDNQNPKAKPSPVAPKATKKKKPSPPKKPPPKRPSSPDEFDDVEMACPVAACPKLFHGITALQTHIGWSHNKNKETKAYFDSESHVLATCLTNRVVDKNLVCFVCKEICASPALLNSHVNTLHIRKRHTVLYDSPKTPSTEGAEKLKSKMSIAFGGLLDRALNNVKLNPQKTRPEVGESSKTATASKISSDTLRLLSHLKEKRRLENAENKAFTSNLAKELRQMLDHKKYDNRRLSQSVDSVTSRRSSIESDAEVSSTTTKNDFVKPFGCPLCPMSFTTSLMRNRHISFHDDRKNAIDQHQPVKPSISMDPPREPSLSPEMPVPKAKAPRKKPVKQPTHFDFECDNCHTTVSCEEDPIIVPKSRRPRKRTTKKPPPVNDIGIDLAMRPLIIFSNDADTESNSSQGSVTKAGMKKKSLKETLAEQEMRQNEAFDLLLGKKPSPTAKPKAPSRKKKPAETKPKDSVKRYEAAAAMKALAKGRLNRSKRELKMPSLKPVEAPTASRVSPDIPAPVLKPIPAEVLKLSDRKTKPPVLLPGALSKNDKASRSIDILSCDSESCKLESPSFDLPEIEPYSSSMVDSPKSSEEDKASVFKRNTTAKKPVATSIKCDNISDLKQLFSDDDDDDNDSDQESKTETKVEDKISPESLKSITAFRDTMKSLKVQGSAEPKSSSVDVYNFED